MLKALTMLAQPAIWFSSLLILTLPLFVPNFTVNKLLPGTSSLNQKETTL
jgi:hypothetical protein